MSKALDAAGFAEYAEQQVAAAETILAWHGATAYGLCRCGQAEPCPVAESHSHRRDYFRTRLAIIQQVVVLPMNQPCPPGGSWQATTAAYLQATSRRLADYFQHHAGYSIWRQP